MTFSPEYRPIEEPICVPFLPLRDVELKPGFVFVEDGTPEGAAAWTGQLTPDQIETIQKFPEHHKNPQYDELTGFTDQDRRF